MHDRDPDHHHPQLAADLEAMGSRMLERRRALGLFGLGAVAATLNACGGGSAGSSSTTSSSASGTGSTGSGSSGTGSSGSGSSGSGGSTAACVTTPTETNGPYPADGTNSANGVVANVLIRSGILRSDIRSSFGDGYGGTAAGVPMKVTIRLVNVGNGCALLAGRAIYLWHCNALGQYSIYSVSAANWLRGVQVTDSAGEVTFTTIVPGCYDGRYPHLHFEVYPSEAAIASYSNRLLTSQFAVPADVCSAVYALSGYSGSSSNFARVSLTSDNVFGDNSSAEIQAMTMVMSGNATDGYSAQVTVGLASA